MGKEGRGVRSISGRLSKILGTSVLLQRVELAVEGGSVEGEGIVEGQGRQVVGGIEEASGGTREGTTNI